MPDLQYTYGDIQWEELRYQLALNRRQSIPSKVTNFSLLKIKTNLLQGGSELKVSIYSVYTVALYI